MRRESWPKRFSTALLGLSLWAALPAIEWCPFTWDECRASCASAEAASENAAACGPVCAIPCDPEPDSSPLGDRAWCIHPPVDGVPWRGLEVPAPDGVAWAELPEAPRAPSPTVTFERHTERSGARPGPAAAHAPPRVRAPPFAA